MADLALIHNGSEYRGWKGVSVTRSIESIAGQFTLDVSDRWADQEESWPIREEDVCTVAIDGVPVITGYIDRRTPSFDGSQISFSYSGKDRAAALVECSGIVTGASTAGNKWTYRNVSVLEFCRAIAKPFGIAVRVQPGLTLAKVPQIVTHPGDSAFTMMSNAAKDDGVLLVSDGVGGVVITRAGNARAQALIEGINVQSLSGEYDASERFYRYLIASQIPVTGDDDGDDDGGGGSSNVIAEAFDPGVQRRERVKLIRPEKNYSAADAKRRADWEARTRAARAEKFQIGVRGWKQTFSDELWPINALVSVQIPRAGLNGDMLISQVQYTINGNGEATMIHVVRPDAFEPEPTKATLNTETGWKELRGF